MKPNLKTSTSSSHPYKYHSPTADGVTFHFTTENSIVYSIALADFSEDFGLTNRKCRLMFFVLEPIKPPAIIPKDSRIRDTIVAFIIEFLSKNKDVVFYVCSNADNQEKARSRLFSMWFKNSKNKIIKKKMKVLSGTETHFIYHHKNIDAEIIVDSI